MKKRIFAAISQKIHLIVILALLADFLLPKTINAQDPSLAKIQTLKFDHGLPEVVFDPSLLVKAGDKKAESETASLPQADQPQPKKTMKLTITAYSSTADQTDNTPCITANGFNVCEHNTEDIVATNFLPFGTKIKIPELYGDKIFMVQDRMHERYWYHLDLWMQSRERARQFGIEYTTIEIF